MGARALLAGALAALPAGALRAQTLPPGLLPPAPTPASYIHDGGPVLDATARARLDARIADVQRATGGDVAVLILRDLQGRAPAEVGVAAYRAWGVGRRDAIGSARRDLGALLLLVPKELAPDGRGECWVTTGLGAEGTLIDARAGSICRDSVVPYLRERDHAGAVGAGIAGIGSAFAATVPGASGAGPAPPPTARGFVGRLEDAGFRLEGLLTLAGIAGGGLGLVGFARWRRVRPRHCPRGHGRMVRLAEAEDDVALSGAQRLEERVGSTDYDVWACSACAERYVVPYRKWWTSWRECPRCNARTLRVNTRTLVPAAVGRPGVEEVDSRCEHCSWHDVSRRVLPAREASSGSGTSSSGSGSSGGGSSFGGSGSTSGGGGGSSY